MSKHSTAAQTLQTIIAYACAVFTAISVAAGAAIYANRNHILKNSAFAKECAVKSLFQNQEQRDKQEKIWIAELADKRRELEKLDKDASQKFEDKKWRYDDLQRDIRHLQDCLYAINPHWNDNKE